MEEKNSVLSKTEKCWTAAKVSLNSNKARNAAIDTGNIQTLGEYMTEYDKLNLKNIDPDIMQNRLENPRLLTTYVIPITLPPLSGEEEEQKIDLIVDNKGHDIAFIRKGENSKEREFELADKLKVNYGEIGKTDDVKGLEILAITDPKKYREALEKLKNLESENIEPEDIEQLEDKIQKDELIKDEKDVLKVKRVKKGILKEAGIEVSSSGKEQSEDEKEQEEQNESEKEIPSNVRSKMGEIFEANPDLNISDLKQMIIIDDARSLGDLLNKDGIRNDGGPVIVLRFREKGARTEDRIVLVQDSRKPMEYNREDKHVTDLIKDKMAQRVTDVKDEDRHLLYTDLEGKTYPVSIRKEPRDLHIEEKERFKDQMEKVLEEREAAVRSGDREGIERANGEMRNIIKDFGIEIPQIENDYNKEIGSEGLEEEMTDRQANLNLGWQALGRVNLEIENTINEINAGSIDPTKKQQLDALTEERKMIIDQYGLVIEPGSSAELTESNLTKEEEKKLEENDEEPDGPDPFNPMKRDRW